MAINKAVKVPKAKISSLDIISFDGGLDQRGASSIRSNNYSKGTNVMVNEQGLATHRLALKRWLPDTVGTVYEVFPATYNDTLYLITADDGKIRYCQDGDTSWTDCGGDNVVNTSDGVVNTFKRVLDVVLILNGEDTLGYVKLSDFTVVHFTKVDDPTTAPTLTLKGLAAGNYKIYYSITYNSVVGQTANSPIKSTTMNSIREQWKTDGSEGVTVTDVNTRPAGAVSWNVYYATAASGGTIENSDMLPLALGLDLAQTTFFDDGSRKVDLSAGTAPDDNSTEGPKAKYGDVIDGRPFLYGVKGDEYAVYIGGDGDYALDFSSNHGGFRLVMNKGSNYYPMSIIGFRSGQGIPSITVMFSNTQGLSKQSIIEQNTITIADGETLVVWAATEQNYGAAGVSSPYGTVNYRGALRFPTTDGFVKMNTDAGRQNVLSTERISDPVIDEVSTMKTSKYKGIVGAAWGNNIYWSIPARGFDYNNEIIVCDVSRTNADVWSIFSIKSQWLGVVSPQDSAAFVYLCQDNHIFRLQKAYVAQDDTSDGLTKPFPMELTTALVGSNTAHNGFYAIVQVVFYLEKFIGTANVSVTYRDYRSGRMVSKDMVVDNGTYNKSSVGNWSSPGYLFNQNLPTKVLTWGDTDVIVDADNIHKDSMRVRLPLSNVVTNELSATISTNLDNSSLVVRSVSFEGQNLGISPDVG